MKRESLIKGILSALVIGVLFGTAFFLYNNHGAEKFIVSNQQPIAYHNGQNTLPDDLQKEAAANTSISVEIGEKSFGLIENADYSLLKDNLSLTHGMKIGEPGFTYIYAFENNVKDAYEDGITVTVDGDAYVYSFVGRYEFNNENEAVLQDYDAPGGIVLYYQRADEYGLQNKYEAMLFKEAE